MLVLFLWLLATPGVCAHRNGPHTHKHNKNDSTMKNATKSTSDNTSAMDYIAKPLAPDSIANAIATDSNVNPSRPVTSENNPKRVPMSN